MQILPVHPFPARMAPELAIARLRELPEPSVVLDPMAGSGTVVRHAADMGHVAIGFDVDPLAVLIGRVWTTPVSEEAVQRANRRILGKALALDPLESRLPWIDEDRETQDFVDYWFGKEQQRDLRCISSAILEEAASAQTEQETACLNVLKVALSRIIVTKEQRASLARDTSHSRPHKVAENSDYKVFEGFDKSVLEVCRRLRISPPLIQGEMALGDARLLTVKDKSVDMVITSPPYLNAIDYIRGHRLSLVWLGYQVSELRTIRSESVGAERAPDSDQDPIDSVVNAMGCIADLPTRYRGMVKRYANDVNCIVKEIARVLKPGASATFVIGNSCLKGVFVRNSNAVAVSAGLNGLSVVGESERELPARHRYLPMTNGGTLGKRMRTETVLKCVRNEDGFGTGIH